ncbi:MAG TPA: flagellar motor switch protein FliM, partial [Rhodanobacter sp.]
MSDLLSQDEIDALLDGVEGGAVSTGNDEPLPRDAVAAYDFTQQDRIVRGRLPTLEMVNERFARFFRTGIFNVLRKTCDVSVLGVSMVKFAEYVHSLALPSNMNMVRIKPLRGTALVVL